VKEDGAMRLYSAILMLFVILSIASVSDAETSPSADARDILVITGVVTDARGEVVKSADLSFFVNGKRVEPKEAIKTSTSGTYEGELTFPSRSLAGTRIQIQVEKPSYKTTGLLEVEDVVREPTKHGCATYYLAYKSVVINRTITPGFWIATVVLIGVYILIAFEMTHRTLAALLGATTILITTYTVGVFDKGFYVLSAEDANAAVDNNVIFLLMGMMMIVGVMKKTGVFQWLAYKSFQVARGNVFVLAVILTLFTAISSSLLDNVTTMLLMIPVTIEIAVTLRLNPLALLLPEVFASNVGGAATLIGDPPNIMIGSYAQLTFLDFLLHIGLICLICLVVSIAYFLLWYRKDFLKARVENVEILIEELREKHGITDRALLVRCLILLGITIFLFVIHGFLGMPPSIAAMIGAVILLAISRVSIVEVLEEDIEWPTLIFFMGLFIVVGGAEHTGLIQIVAEWVKEASRGSLVVAILLILWSSALVSAVVDNIAFTATMLPVVAYLTDVIPGAQGGILWWALALGACFGGNGTIVGASANVVTVGMAEKAGCRISFIGYMKACFPPMVLAVAMASVSLLAVML
jgi:Na+/H+ antiporter NhaD/arsenite permease-like protein